MYVIYAYITAIARIHNSINSAIELQFLVFVRRIDCQRNWNDLFSMNVGNIILFYYFFSFLRCVFVCFSLQFRPTQLLVDVGCFLCDTTFFFAFSTLFSLATTTTMFSMKLTVDAHAHTFVHTAHHDKNIIIPSFSCDVRCSLSCEPYNSTSNVCVLAAGLRMFVHNGPIQIQPCIICPHTCSQRALTESE